MQGTGDNQTQPLERIICFDDALHDLRIGLGKREKTVPPRREREGTEESLNLGLVAGPDRAPLCRGSVAQNQAVRVSLALSGDRNEAGVLFCDGSWHIGEPKQPLGRCAILPPRRRNKDINRHSDYDSSERWADEAQLMLML